MSFSFVHLRVHSEYSLVDGLVKVKPLIKSVVDAGMPAVAVTDQNNMCSLVKFYRGAASNRFLVWICGCWVARTIVN